MYHDSPASEVKSAAIPAAVADVLHWTEAVNERLAELSSRLSRVLRNEPLEDKTHSLAPPSTSVALANDIHEAALRARVASERAEDILRRLEL